MCGCGGGGCRNCSPYYRNPFPQPSSPARLMLVPETTDHAPEYSVGDEVTLVVRGRIIRKAPQSGSAPTRLTILPRGDGEPADVLDYVFEAREDDIMTSGGREDTVFLVALKKQS